MTDNIQPGVRERLDTPRHGEEASLIVGVVDSDSDDVVESIEATGAEVQERLFYDSLAVTAPEQCLADLCSLDVVTSVEMEGKWEPMDEGNLNIHGTPP